MRRIDFKAAPQLSVEEEKALAERARAGDTDARNQLASTIFALAQEKAGEYKVQGIDPDDLLQEALLAALEAAGRFDPSVGCRFSTFGGRTIEYELLHFVTRPRVATCTEVGLTNLVGKPDTRDAQSVEDEDEQRALYAAIDSLEPEHRQVIRARLEGVYSKELAARLGVSRQILQTRTKKALAALRERLS